MGHQISAKDDSINYSRGAWIICKWCDKFSPPSPPEGMDEETWLRDNMGVTDISAEAVRIADANVPEEYEEAKRLGLTDPPGVVERYGRIDEEEFNKLRAFLKRAAERGSDIWGSH